MQRGFLVIGLRLAAALLAAASLALLSALLQPGVLATVLKLQALAVAAMTVSNLGAIPYVANRYANSGADRYGLLWLWLRRRCAVAAAIGFALTLSAGLGGSPAEQLVFAVCVAVWSCAYAYELTDVALLSDDKAVFAGVTAVTTAALGFALKVAASLWMPRVEVLVSLSVAETAIRFIWQLAKLRADAREQGLSPELSKRGIVADFPVMASSIVNAAAARIDQYFATRWLSDGQAATYLLCCRFFDAVWLLPFTILNLALAKVPSGRPKRDGFRHVLGAVGVSIVGLMVIACYISAVNRQYRDAIPVMALLAPTLLALVHHSLAWRWEAEAHDTTSGFMRSVLQLAALVAVVGATGTFLPMTAVVLAAVIAVGRFGGVALSLIVVKGFRAKTAQVFATGLR